MRPASLLALVSIGVLGGCTVHAPGSSEEAGGLPNGSFTAELDGFRIHYEVHGRGPVLMALPNSWGLSLQALRAMYRPLEERLTLVYFDPRGMGGSGPVREDADRGRAAVRADFEALRQHLGLAKVSAIGWSNGAINLIWLAHDHPESLSSALFLHGIASFTEEDRRAFSREHPDLVKAYTAFQKEVSDPDMPVSEKTARQRKMTLEVYFPTLFADRAAAPAALEKVFGEAELSWPHADYENRESFFDARDMLAAIPVRSLVMAGAHDMAPPEKVKALADGLPHSKFVVFEHSGHFAPVEEPAAFQVAVYGFLGVGGETASR
jgi:proline iminopeptidase